VLEIQNVIMSRDLRVNIVPAGAPLLYALGAPGAPTSGST
jgi:hypothetical protein